MHDEVTFDTTDLLGRLLEEQIRHGVCRDARGAILAVLDYSQKMVLGGIEPACRTEVAVVIGFVMNAAKLLLEENEALRRRLDATERR